MTILKTKSEEGGQIRISGGYTDIEWTSCLQADYKEGSGNSFIFSLRNNMRFIILDAQINKKKFIIIVIDYVLLEEKISI